MASRQQRIGDLLPDVGPLGPAMKALPSEKYRNFVRAYFVTLPGKGQNVRAAKLSGFGLPSSNARTMSAIAARLMADERVAAAIAEVGQIVIRSLGAPAAVALKTLIEDSSHRHHFRAVAFVAERIAPSITMHNVNVQHDVTPSLELTTEVLAKIKELAERFRVKLPPPQATIEGDFEVVDKGTLQ